MIPSGQTTIVTGLAGNSSFVFPFKTFEDTDIVAKVRLLADNTETPLVLTTHFTLTGIGNQNGGTLKLVPEPPIQDWMDGVNLKAGYEIFISFKADIKQLTKLRDLGRNSPFRIEEALDRLTMFFLSFFSGIGDVARSIKLPPNTHPDETAPALPDFDPILPDGFNSAEDNLLAINAARTGFKVIQQVSNDISYIPGAVQSLGAGASIVVALLSRQHLRVKSTGGALTLGNTPFGTNDALLKDGMEIVVEGDSAADTLQIDENAGNHGFEGNGGVIIKFPFILTFIYNANKKKFLLKSNGAW